jgi:hypothetical protein
LTTGEGGYALPKDLVDDPTRPQPSARADRQGPSGLGPCWALARSTLKLMSNRLTNDEVRKLGHINAPLARRIRRGETAPGTSSVNRIRAALYRRQLAEEAESASATHHGRGGPS